MNGHHLCSNEHETAIALLMIAVCGSLKAGLNGQEIESLAMTMIREEKGQEHYEQYN